MTVKPCSNCGGTGEVGVKSWSRWICDGEVKEPCPRCDGMPKLAYALNKGGSIESYRAGWERGWFFPDPDTVMWWCFEHDSYINDMDNNVCEDVELEVAFSYPDVVYTPDPCRPAWVPRPDKPLALE